MDEAAGWAGDLAAIRLSLELAALTTLILLVLGTPLAWWLARTRSRLRPLIETVTALPLVLPPTVLGFYLLVLMAPSAPLGALWVRLTGHTLSFSFAGLVLASVLYSLPFVVQPLQAAFEAVGRAPIEAARLHGAGPLDAFATVAAPLALRGYVTGAVLGFAHTLGEFGVVLMVGGNIPGQTQVIAIRLYNHVELLEYGRAHLLSAGLLAFSFAVLLVIHVVNRRIPFGAGR